MNNLKSLENKKICILGFGIENQALVKFLLAKKINCDITICDKRKEAEFPTCASPLASARRVGSSAFNRIKWQLGKNYDCNLSEFDIIFRIAGYPLFSPQIKKAKQAGVKISSPTKLFFEFCPTKNIIGVTGTKGKGTTATLIYRILKMAGKRVFFGGNIGIPMFSFLDKIKFNDWVVLELSSFQLEDMEVSPKIAVITNFTREHLAPADPNNPNYHKNLGDYRQAKLNIIRWQKKSDQAVINKMLDITRLPVSLRDEPARQGYWKLGEGKKINFTKSGLPSRLVGEHNKENIAAAVVVARVIGVKNDIIKKTVANFKGLEHRLELVRELDGVKYYDDSFATTPESTIIALKSFTVPIILLAGGADKGSSFKRLAKEIKKRVKSVILLAGVATPRIKKELLKIKYPEDKIKLVKSMKQSIKIAKTGSVPGDVVLLSTACASFGMFKNYKARGKLFKEAVKIIK